jgi:hypothetical protein
MYVLSRSIVWAIILEVCFQRRGLVALGGEDVAETPTGIDYGLTSFFWIGNSCPRNYLSCL